MSVDISVPIRESIQEQFCSSRTAASDELYDTGITEEVQSLSLATKVPCAGAAQKLNRPLHILVADDQPVLCQMLQEYLSHELHSVETAVNGREALQKFRIHEFDLVIT